MKDKYLSIRTDQETLDKLDVIVNYANENLLPAQNKANKTTIIESLITFAYETMPKDEGETLVGMSQERGNNEKSND